MIILLHSSKTMRPNTAHKVASQPQLHAKASELANYLKTLNPAEIASCMHVSPALAEITHQLLKGWDSDPARQTPAIDCFLGDIYSGLQAGSFNEEQRTFAHEHLRIISGLYGVLRALDGIHPYRLEMAYRLPDDRYKKLYSFWGDSLAQTLHGEKQFVNLLSDEYAKAVLPFLKGATIVAPRFLTLDAKTNQPKFVVVHAKIARGACAHWLITNQVQDLSQLRNFNELGYKYNAELSTPEQPVFVTTEFGGLGLSVRLTGK